jgi:hypothetical protein
MRITFLILVILCAGCAGKREANINKQMMKMYNGRRSWPYFKLPAKTRGVIVNHVKAADCGYFITASVSVIETDKKDTIRVLELCNSKKKFNKGDSVVITPGENSFYKFKSGERSILDVTLQPDSLYDYKHYKTCYGVVNVK